VGALRALQERAALTRRLAERARAKQHPSVLRAFEERAAAVEAQVEAVRQVLSSRTSAHVVPDHTIPEEPAAALNEGEG
jgi:hypothetical protein